MDFRELKLDGSLVAAMYKTNLVEGAPVPAGKKAVTPVAAPPAEPGQPVNTIQFLGKNEKHVCVLVSYEKDKYLPDAQLNFLTAILQACKLNLADVAIVNQQKQHCRFIDLKEQLQCTHLLLFGVTPAELDLPGMPQFETMPVDGCMVVAAPAAEILNNNQPEGKSLKSRLWLCLKQAFGV
jgi:hypothetical protein